MQLPKGLAETMYLALDGDPAVQQEAALNLQPAQATVAQRFISDESGRGITMYGAIIGVCMIAAGLVWGWLEFKAPRCSGTAVQQQGSQHQVPQFSACAACGRG